MKLRALLLVCLLGLSGCAPDYLDLGYDLVSTGTGSTTGSGGAGGGGVCAAGETQECYSGPVGTKGQGICKAGQQTCNKDGTGFGTCKGEVLPQPAENCATPVDDDCNGAAPACSGTVLWAKGFGDANSQFARGVAVDGGGNVLLTGSFLGSIDFGGSALGPPSSFYAAVFAAKLDPTGAHLWSRSFVDALAQRARGITTDAAGNVVVAGDFDGSIDFGDGAHASSGGSDAFLVKLDTSGVTLWSKAFGDPKNQAAYAVATDAQGNILVAGAFAGKIDFGEGPHASAAGSDVFFAKLDANGATLWSRAFGGTDDQAAYGLATDAQGNVVVAGAFGGTIDFGDGVHASAGGSDVFLAKLDPSGATLWSKTFGDVQDQGVYALAMDPQGNIILAGSFGGTINFGDGAHTSAGGSDVFLAKLDPNGATSWSKAFGDTKDGQTAYSVAADLFGNVVVAGGFDGVIDFGTGPLTSGGGPDIFLAKLDPNGGALWSKRFGDKGVQSATSVATDPTGAVLMTGYLDGTVDVGAMTVTSAGAEDVVVVKLAP